MKFYNGDFAIVAPEMGTYKELYNARVRITEFITKYDMYACTILSHGPATPQMREEGYGDIYGVELQGFYEHQLERYYPEVEIID